MSDVLPTEIRVRDASSLAPHLLAALVGLAACVLAAYVGGVSLKRLFFSVAPLAVASVAFATKQPKRVLLFLWIVSLTYNRQIYSFDALLGDSGSQGLYWVPADPFLLMLLGIWFVESARSKRAAAPRGPRMWPWLLPFVVACLFSAFAAEQVSWGLYEMARVARVALILVYLRFNVGRSEWWVCVGALGCAVVAQSLLGGLQVTMNVGSGLMAIFGGAGTHLEDGAITLDVGGRLQARGAGTMAHPNILGPYLLLIVPAFLALALTCRGAAWRIVSAAIALLGLIGIASTMSRLPWILAALEVAALLLTLTWVGMLRLKRLVATLVLGAFAAQLAILPAWGFVRERFRSNLTESWQFRADYNRVALSMFRESPFTGIGLNNFRARLDSHAPLYEQILRGADDKRREYNVRVTAPVHNIYLLLLTETGVWGLGTFLVLIAGTLWTGASAVRSTTGARRAVCIGLLIGILAELVQQTMDFSLWVDPGLYTFALILGLLGTAPQASEELAPRVLPGSRAAHTTPGFQA